MPVSKPSTTRGTKPGPTRSVASLAPGRSAPSTSSQALSSARTTEVPTATTRPPSAFARAAASTVAAGTSERSGSGRAASIAASPVDDRPAACVTRASRTPRPRRARRSGRTRGRPADGISAAMGRPAYGVCTRRSGSASRRYEYWTGFPAWKRADHSEAPSRSKRRTTSRGEMVDTSTTSAAREPSSTRSPGRSRGGGGRSSVRSRHDPGPNTAAGQRSNPPPSLGGPASRISTGRPRAVPGSDAGSVAASFTTRRSPG